MANVNVENGRYTVDSLYQWDMNQVLEIYGLSLPSVPEIHFTNTAMDKAIVRQATMDSAGVITASVPNALLQVASKITAYVCIYEGDSFNSLYKIEIPVIARAKPNNYSFVDDNDEVYSFNALENLVINTLDTLNTQYDKAIENVNQLNDRVDEMIETSNVFLPVVGGTMKGAIDMSGNAISNLPDPTEDGQAVTKKYVDQTFLTSDSASEDFAKKGHGIGDDTNAVATDNDANLIVEPGLYAASVNTPTDNVWYITHHVIEAGATETQEGIDSVTGCTAKRVMTGGNWGAWLWNNPPMEVDTEYATTEKYLGSVVYTKIVDCGYLELDSTEITVRYNPNTTSVRPIRCAVSGDGCTLPAYQNKVYAYANSYNVIVGATMQVSWSSVKTYAQIWYIK